MRRAIRTAFPLSFLLATCLLLGCGEDGTGPDNHAGSSPGKHLWNKRFGDTDRQYAWTVANDASGDVIIAGHFSGTVDFGGGAFATTGYPDEDIFVAKFTSDGGHLWSKRFGDENENQSATAVAVDASGNVIVAGGFSGTVDFGGGALTSTGGNKDIFVAKFASNGAHILSKGFGDENSQSAHSVAIDASGNIIVVGCFDGTVDFGGGAFTTTGFDDEDIFVAKFGPDGSHLWSRQFGDEWDQSANGVAIDASGNVIVAGYADGAIVDFGGGPLACWGGDIFVAKFGPDGAHLWSKLFGDRNHQGAGAVAVDASGNVIVAGTFSGAVDFGGGTLTSAGGRDIFVAMLGSNGAHLWSKGFGDDIDQFLGAVAVDPSGSVIVTGEFSGTVDFGGGALTGVGWEDIYVAKFGSAGHHLWSKRFGDTSGQSACDVAIDPSGNVILTGHFGGTVDFGGGALTSAGGADIFIAKFGP